MRKETIYRYVICINGREYQQGDIVVYDHKSEVFRKKLPIDTDNIDQVKHMVIGFLSDTNTVIEIQLPNESFIYRMDKITNLSFVYTAISR